MIFTPPLIIYPRKIPLNREIKKSSLATRRTGFQPDNLETFLTWDASSRKSIHGIDSPSAETRDVDSTIYADQSRFLRQIAVDNQKESPYSTTAVPTLIHESKIGVKLGDTFLGMCTLINPLDWR